MFQSSDKVGSDHFRLFFNVSVGERSLGCLCCHLLTSLSTPRFCPEQLRRAEWPFTEMGKTGNISF